MSTRLRLLAVRELLRARDRGWPNPPVVLRPLKEVNKWMDNMHKVDHEISVFERTQLWMSLRLLHGLDLDDFLLGSRHAYTVVSQLLQDGQWDALAPLVQPTCLDAMRDLGGGGLPTDGDESISIVSAVLSSAHLLEPCERTGVLPGTAHLDVKFTALQGVTLHDLQHGATSLAMAPRLQESMWTFEGVVRADGDDDDAAAGWQVRDISWQVWEVEQAPSRHAGCRPSPHDR